MNVTRFILAAALTTTYGLVGATAAQGAMTVPANYFYLTVQEDGFATYDNKQMYGADHTNVDWPVTLFFYGNADIDYIKDQFDYAYSSITGGGDPKYHFGGDFPALGPPTASQPGYYWDSDDGKKTPAVPCFGDTRHYRIYADSDDRLYTTGVGFYVLGTTHKDFDELCNPHFGESEQTERDIAQRAKIKQWNVYEDFGFFYNDEMFCPRSTNTFHPPCPGRTDLLDGNHQWQSSGYATYIQVP